MGWFDEQIRNRRKADSEAFEEAFIDIAGAIMGRKLGAALKNDRIQTQNAIEEILKFYHVKARQLPDSITDQEDVLPDVTFPVPVTLVLLRHILEH